MLLLHLGGLSLRDDVIERRNTAALAALAGAVLGVGGAFGVVLQGTELAQLLVEVSAVALAVPASWWGLSVLGRTHDLVTIDRDEGAGVRAGVILAGVGLACARGLALGHGSLERVVISSWPALALVVGGAYFTLGSVGRFDEAMTAGKGFIGLAAMIFGNWNPIGAYTSSLIFGFADSLQVKLQILRIPIPSEFLLMAPYIVTMIILTGVVGRAIPPAADGQPYEK